MNKTLNELLQLQELQFTLYEQQALVSKARLADLENSIKELLADLPQPVAGLYQQLNKRHQAVVVPESQGACSACAMSLPTSQASDIRQGKGPPIQQCPNCKRILYHFEGAPRQLKKDLQRGAKPKDGVARFTSEDLMVPHLVSDDRDGIIGELVELMAQKEFVDNPDALLAAALRREAIVSTALDRGLAFPHVRGVEGGGLTFSLGLKKDGVKFDSSSDRLTYIIFLIVSPAAVSGFYLKLFSGLIETFREETARNKILACDTPEKMWRSLKTLTKKSIQ